MAWRHRVFIWFTVLPALSVTACHKIKSVTHTAIPRVQSYHGMVTLFYTLYVYLISYTFFSFILENCNHCKPQWVFLWWIKKNFQFKFFRNLEKNCIHVLHSMNCSSTNIISFDLMRSNLSDFHVHYSYFVRSFSKRFMYKNEWDMEFLSSVIRLYSSK